MVYFGDGSVSKQERLNSLQNFSLKMKNQFKWEQLYVPPPWTGEQEKASLRNPIMSDSMLIFPIFLYYEWTQVKMNIEMNKGDQIFAQCHANAYGHVLVPCDIGVK